jgi:predicted nuclease of predicted toxin-antitoxin system
VKLFLDENLSPQHATELRAEGFDACAVAEVGLSGAPDEQIREYAIEESRILVTLDADFAHIIRFPPEHTPGVVRLKVHPPTEQRIRQAIRRAVALLKNTDLAGCLVVVDENKIRIRH